jgi:hypothetical protein
LDHHPAAGPGSDHQAGQDLLLLAKVHEHGAGMHQVDARRLERVVHNILAAHLQA